MVNEHIQEFIKNIERCNCDKIHMVPPAFMHAVIGMTDEMGELSEILKRALYYGDRIDNDHILEELGDMMFYIMLECMRQAAVRGMLVSEVFQRVLDGNVSKLKKRFPEGFSEAKATESGRDREAERQAMNKPELEKLQAKPGVDRASEGGF